ncbi:hypothetical protein LZ30DRAFT_386326 [Colletotrichum cereale]|nr:hypothetical protein LZ30DRAFT_386326 [Colletotrichum cereale]
MKSGAECGAESGQPRIPGIEAWSTGGVLSVSLPHKPPTACCHPILKTLVAFPFFFFLVFVGRSSLIWLPASAGLFVVGAVFISYLLRRIRLAGRPRRCAGGRAKSTIVTLGTAEPQKGDDVEQMVTTWAC